MATVNPSRIAPPAPSLDKIHLALSHIACRRAYRPPLPPGIPSLPNTSADNRHLELLNLLLLLLVTGSKGDVAAVMFSFLSNDRLELHYAKNRPFTNKENSYIRSIHRIVSREGRRDRHLLCWDISAQVIPDCKRKITSRIEKVCIRLRELAATNGSSSFGIYEGGCTTETDEMVHQALGPDTFASSRTVPQFLRAWFDHLLKKAEEGSTVWHVGTVHLTLSLAFY